VKAADFVFEHGGTEEDLQKALGDIIGALHPWRLDKAVTEGIISSFYPVWVEVLGTQQFEPETLCTRLHLCTSDSDHSVPTRPPRHTQPIPRPPTSPDDIGHFVFVSDLHVDLLYTTNTRVDCGEIQCCDKGDDAGLARQWGEYGFCDAPLTLMDSLLADAASHNPDFVLFAGDCPPHDVWRWTLSTTTDAISTVADSLEKAFPSPMRVLPAFGNHDSFPIGQVRGPGYDADFFETVTNDYARWLSADEQTTMKFGGWYTTLLSPGHRLVTLNTNYGWLINFWLLLNKSGYDVGGQLKWLDGVLTSAAAANESVWIQCHIPLGEDDFDGAYAREIRSTIMKHPGVVKAMFHGHTHKDHLTVMYDDNGDPMVTEWVAPSGTTWGESADGVNPTYRIYSYDKNTGDILDYDQYITNLTDSYVTGKLSFEKAYSVKEEYGMVDLEPATVANFTDRLWEDDALFDRYYVNANTQRQPASACGSECRKSWICKAQSSNFELYLACLVKHL
jgi:sphingomyelin phosphodiesterase